MDSIVFLIFRRMRQPLILLIVTYSISILGLIFIPGLDNNGKVWHMDFFHAFYFVSFMATTIGFGEIPYEFTDPQRIWITFTLYATVIVWFYAIGNVLSLVQNPAFQEALVRARFNRKIKALREPFYLICGYGDVGEILLQELAEHHYRAVVIEKDESRVNFLKLLAGLPEEVPILHADASISKYLLEAGLDSPYCKAVVALTNNDRVNLKIAISSKALHPETKVICRTESNEIEANMTSFGTDHIIDPFDTFAIHLSTAITTPCLYLLQNWINSGSPKILGEPIYPPSQGLWILCGYGRFGKAVYSRLKAEGIKIIIIELRPELTGKPDNIPFVIGAGTDEKTLKEAQIEEAVGLVAGTNDDINNLSIVMTAKLIKPNLFVVMRQNQGKNAIIINSAKADMIMDSGEILANKVRNLLAYPLLDRFIGLAFFQDNSWACEIASRIAAITTHNTPHVWSIKIDKRKAFAIVEALTVFKPICIKHLLIDYRNRDKQLPCIPLLLVRENSYELLPKIEKKLKVGDSLLFCAEPEIRFQMEWVLLNSQVLSYVLTGKYTPQGIVWRKIKKMLQKKKSK